MQNNQCATPSQYKRNHEGDPSWCAIVMFKYTYFDRRGAAYLGTGSGVPINEAEF